VSEAPRPYDPECRALAEHFLADRPKPVPAATVDKLARRVQATVEDFLAVLDAGIFQP
jgi:hypothetical protein